MSNTMNEAGNDGHNCAVSVHGNLTTTSRAFGRWIAEKRGVWPAPLMALAERALFALRSLEQSHVSPALEAGARADVQAFLTAHATPHG